MLVLTIKDGRSFTIDTGWGPATVTVNGRHGSATAIGIDAPRQCAIHRDNIKHEKPRQKRDKDREGDL